MRPDDRFDELVVSLGGFYRTWFVYAGLELGLLERLRAAGEAGLAVEALARDTGTEPELVRRWAWGADVHDLVVLRDDRVVLFDDVAAVLLDPDRPEYLGGQFLHAATGSFDFAELPEVFRTGRPVGTRPDRYRIAIERLTVQDVAVFFQEVLAALPQLVVDLQDGALIIDIHCGGGRWLVAMARRFASARLIGVEFESDSVERARTHVADSGLAERIAIEHGDLGRIGHAGEATLAYFQYALHQLADPTGAVGSAWAAVRPGGWLVALDWYLPTDPDELRTRHAELIAGVQLDELIQGTRLVTRDEALSWFAAAGVPDAQLIDLPSGASAIVAQRA